jgi:hypothetical protein
MRNMSFQRSAAPMLARAMTVTRRVGWRDLAPGELVQAVGQTRGLPKGAKVQRLGVIRVVSVRRESLARLEESRYCKLKDANEGLPGLSGRELVERFVAATGCRKNAVVTRIEFEHV